MVKFFLKSQEQNKERKPGNGHLLSLTEDRPVKRGVKVLGCMVRFFFGFVGDHDYRVVDLYIFRISRIGGIHKKKTS